jgi:AcrR family transcriptional regulator
MKSNVREQIIAAAWSSFEERGMAGTNADDIAASVGISRSSFYRYFKGMDEIITEIALTRGKRNLAEALSRAMPHAADGSLWSHFVFYAVTGITRDRFQSLLGNNNALHTVDLVYRSNQAAFAQLVEVLLPTLKADQQRRELTNSIDAEAMAEWLLRQIWCLASAPPPGGWTDDALLQYARQFIVPGMTAPSGTGDVVQISDKLDRIQQSIAALERRLADNARQAP